MKMKMKTKTKTKTKPIMYERYEVIKEAKRLGFLQIAPDRPEERHIFKHPDIPIFFDFSATAPDKILLTVWKCGIKAGRVQKAMDFQGFMESFNLEADDNITVGNSF